MKPPEDNTVPVKPVPEDQTATIQHDGITSIDSQRNEVSSEWAPGTIIADEYKVIRLLGRGGMGTVYLVERDFDGVQFAAKTVSPKASADSTVRKNFMGELSTWIGLPEHDNIVSCRFFRTYDKKLILFLEYVPGHSLADRIKKTTAWSMAEKLDIAIQITRGLKIAHQNGIIHQDVKPANVLVSENMVVKITDFGLSRALSTATRQEVLDERLRTSLVSTGGMTPRYCSPEQSQRQKVSFKTDMYSFGVLLLELLTGKVSWQYGPFAAQYLEDIITNPGLEYDYMVNSNLQTILRRCLKTDPAERWSDMSELEEQLVLCYHEMSGSIYNRQVWKLAAPDADSDTFFSFNSAPQRDWHAPRHWLSRIRQKAAVAIDEDHFEAERVVNTEKTTITKDLEYYDELYLPFKNAQFLYPTDLRPDFAVFLQHKSFVHGIGGDISGALDAIEEAIEIVASLIEESPTMEYYRHYLQFSSNKANFLIQSARYTEAEKVYKHMLETVQWNPYKHIKAIERFAYVARYNHATLIMKQGRYSDAIQMLGGVIEFMEECYYQTNQFHLLMDLTYSSSNKAFALMRLGKLELSLEYYDKALYFLMLKSERAEFVQDMQHEEEMAWLYRNKANILTMLNQTDDADRLLSKSIDILENLVFSLKQTTMQKELADSYVCKAFLHSRKKEFEKSAEMIVKNIAILETLILKEGQTSLYKDLASSHMNMAEIARVCENYDNALNNINATISILEKMTAEKERSDLLGDLVQSYCIKAKILAMTAPEMAISLLKKTLPELQVQAEASGRNDLMVLINDAEELMQKLAKGEIPDPSTL